MSVVVTQSMPAPQHNPLTAVSTGLPSCEMGVCPPAAPPLVVSRQVWPFVDDLAVLGNGVDVGPVQKRPTRAGDDGQPYLVAFSASS